MLAAVRAVDVTSRPGYKHLFSLVCAKLSASRQSLDVQGFCESSVSVSLFIDLVMLWVEYTLGG